MASVVEGVAEMQTKTGQYNRPSAWASGKIARAPHEWHAAWSTGPTRRVGMVVLSKATGAGEPERNWGDVKQVYDKGKASMDPEKAEKKVLIYGSSRRDPSLSGKISSSLKDDAWTKDDEVWDGLGLAKWGYADVVALTEAVTQSRRRFYNYTEAKHDDTVTKNVKPENGAALVAKYNGMRFFDDDTDDGMGAYFRIRSDTFSWLGKRQGGWAATCDEVPSGDPSEDPAGDIELTDEYEPERYVINESLHTMIAKALQAPGVVLVDEDSDDEEIDDDEKG